MNRYLIAVVVTLLVVLGLYRWGYHNGWGTRDAEMQTEIAKKNEESRQTEQQLAEQINANATKLKEAHDALDQKSSALDRAIRAGRMRLPSASCVQAAPGAPAAAGDRAQAPNGPAGSADPAIDSERATLAAIAAIVAEGQRNTEQLNACIDAYNQVKEQLNGQR